MFKVGDKVRVKKGLKAGAEYDGGCSFTSGMNSYAGETLIIINKYQSIDGCNRYQIKDNLWFWTDSMLEPVVEPKFKVGDKVVPVSKRTSGCTLDTLTLAMKANNYKYLRITGIKKEVIEAGFGVFSWLFLESDLIPYVEQRPQNYAPENGTRFFKHCLLKNNVKFIYNNQAIICIFNEKHKGIAKCSPNDKWNETHGKNIALMRALIKQCQAELKKLTGRED